MTFESNTAKKAKTRHCHWPEQLNNGSDGIDHGIGNTSKLPCAPYRSRYEYEQILGYTITDKTLYDTAFTHKSALKEYIVQNTESNERLEFLGDSVLNFVVTRYLYDKFPRSPEGFLTRIRTKLVSGKMLAILSTQLKFPTLLVMNERAVRQNWSTNPRIAEDVFESVIGAMYLDQGLPRCRTFITHVLETLVDWKEVHQDSNYKDRLMRTCQYKGWDLPDYRLVSTSGPDHKKMFVIEVIVENKVVGRGTDYAKRNAEQLAAEEAINMLNISIPTTSSSYTSPERLSNNV